MNATPLPQHLVPTAAVPDVPTRTAALACRDFTPFAIAVVPFALTIGATNAASEVSLSQTLFGAFFLMAGTAQLTASELLGQGTDVFVTVGTMLVINARFFLYGGGLAQWFPGLSRRQLLVLAIPIVDQTFLGCEQRFETMTDTFDRRRYYVAGTAFLFSCYVAGQVVGYLVGPVVPSWLGLHLAAPLAFVGMLVRAVPERHHAAAAATGATVVIAAAALPAGLGLPLAVIAGVFVGTRTEGAAK